jgi:hypothetical protein
MNASPGPSARLYGQFGKIDGAFTCSEDVAKYLLSSLHNLFWVRARDVHTASLRYVGLDVSGSYCTVQAGGLTSSLAVAVTFLYLISGFRSIPDTRISWSQRARIRCLDVFG